MYARFSNSAGSMIWFMWLWLAVALIVSLLVALEMALLAASGRQYHSKNHIEDSGVRRLSVFDRSHRAGVFFHRERGASQPVQMRLELYDGKKVPYELPLEAGVPHSVALSSNRKLAISTNRGTLHLWELPKPPLQANAIAQALKGLPLFQPTEHTCVDRLAFSPNGQFLMANGDGFFVWNATSRERLAIPNENNEKFLCFFPDSTRMLTTTQRGVLRIRDLLSPRTFHDVRIGNDEIKGAAISPNAESVLVATPEGRLMVWSLAESRELWRKYGTRLPHRIAMSNEFAAFVELNGMDAAICDAKTGESPNIVRRHDRQLLGLSWVGSELYSWDLSGELERMTTNIGPPPEKCETNSISCVFGSRTTAKN